MKQCQMKSGPTKAPWFWLGKTDLKKVLKKLCKKKEQWGRRVKWGIKVNSNEFNENSFKTLNRLDQLLSELFRTRFYYARTNHLFWHRRRLVDNKR
jgi:hypothetical protein